jgi:tetratricopeptide (TPR) repeat protein
MKPIHRRKPSQRRRYAVLVFLLAALAASVAMAWKPSRIAWHMRSARQAMSRAEVDTALATLLKAEKIDPNHAGVQYLLGAAYRRAGKIDKVNERLDRALQRGWPAEDVARQRQLIVVQSGDFAAARPFLNAMMSRDNASAEAQEEVFEAMAHGYLITYQLEEAKGCLFHWLQFQPEAVQARLWLADLHERAYNPKAAINEYRTILASFPAHYEARRRLGHVLLKVHEVAEAMEHLEYCRQRSPNDALVQLGTAEGHRRLGNLAEARAALARTLALKPNDDVKSLALLELGRTESKDKNYPKAIEYLERAVKLAPYKPDGHYALGLACRLAGQTEKGQKHIKRSRDLQKQLNRVTMLTEAIATGPDSAEARYELGKQWKALGNRSEALAWLVTAVRLDPRYKEAHDALAECYREQGLGELARRHAELSKQGDARPPKPAEAGRPADARPVEAQLPAENRRPKEEPPAGDSRKNGSQGPPSAT